MKKIILILFLAIPLYAQMNPDGYIGGMSISIEGYGYSGSSENTIEQYKYNADYPGTFNFGVTVKLPLSPNLTLGAYYAQAKTDYKLNDAILGSQTSTFTGKRIGGFLNIYLRFK